MDFKRKRTEAPSSTDDSASSSSTGHASSSSSYASSSPPDSPGCSSSSHAASEDLTLSNQIKSFTHAEIEEATNFDPQHLLGEGSYGTVYKGTLKRSEQVVAIKVVVASKEKDFQLEVAMHCRFTHPNIIKLIGISSRGRYRSIILEYMSKGSLFDQLHNRKSETPLDWRRRLRIALGVAEGLKYLHNLDAPVIHGDIKSPNILLDQHFIPKISDFGCAIFGPTGTGSKSGIKMKAKDLPKGTLGYKDPQFNSKHKLTTKADVYSFGVVLLELITGRRARYEDSAGVLQGLAKWANDTWEKSKDVGKLVDSNLEFSKSTMQKTAELAFMCLVEKAKHRPTMRKVAWELHKICAELKQK